MCCLRSDFFVGLDCLLSFQEELPGATRLLLLLSVCVAESSFLMRDIVSYIAVLCVCVCGERLFVSTIRGVG